MEKMDKLSLLFQWNGKINRQMFLLFIFLSILFSIIIAYIEKLISPDYGGVFLFLLVYLLLATFVKRMRDIHLSSWYLISIPSALFAKKILFFIANIMNVNLHWYLLSIFPNEMTLNPQSVLFWVSSPFWIPFLILFMMALLKKGEIEDYKIPSKIKKIISIVVVGSFILIIIVYLFRTSEIDKNKEDCNNNDVHACYDLGVIYHKGLTVEKNNEKALFFLEKSCTGGYYKACNNAGFLYLNIQNYIKSTELYTKSCEGKYAMGCYNLGRAYRYGRGVEENNQKAIEFLQKACTYGYDKACEEY